MENESHCPGTERFTVDVNGVQVAGLTADAVQSLAINHANSSVTLALPLNRSLPGDAVLLSQPLPQNAVTLNMTKYNTVHSNRSDVAGNIVTKMVTWGTSAVFSLQESPSGGESPATGRDEGVLISTTASLVALWVATVTVFGVVTAVLSWQNFKLKQKVSQQRSPSHSSPPLLFHPKALTASNSNQIPATVQWRRVHQ